MTARRNGSRAFVSRRAWMAANTGATLGASHGAVAVNPYLTPETNDAKWAETPIRNATIPTVRENRTVERYTLHNPQMREALEAIERRGTSRERAIAEGRRGSE